MHTPRWLLPVVAGALLVFGAIAGVSASHASVEARLARQATSQALKDAARAATVAATAQHQALQLQVQRDSAVARSTRAAASEARLRASYHVAVAAAPVICRPVVLTADSALAAADSVQSQLRVALAASEKSEAALQTAVDSLVPALQHLRVTSTALVHIDTKLAHRSLLAKLLPHVGGGMAVGLDATGAPHLITGITLGWSL